MKLTWKYSEEAGGVDKPFDWEFPTLSKPLGEFNPSKSDIEGKVSPAISTRFNNK